MPAYRTTFLVHIIPSLLPQGWPNPYPHEVILDAKNFEEFNEILNKVLVNIFRTCMVITKDSNKPLAENVETLNRRLCISPNIISHLEQHTEELTMAVPPPKEWLN
jgi:hypothetical protein